MMNLQKRRRNYWTGFNQLAKNLIITVLVFFALILVGVIMITNYDWFSQEWLIGIAISGGSIAGIVLVLYLKMSK